MARSTFGVVEPYAAIGPSAVISTVDLNTAVPDPTDQTVDIGVDFRLGVTVMMWENLGIFGEYRLTYAQPDFDLTTQTVVAERLDTRTGLFHLGRGVDEGLEPVENLGT